MQPAALLKHGTVVADHFIEIGTSVAAAGVRCRCGHFGGFGVCGCGGRILRVLPCGTRGGTRGDSRSWTCRECHGRTCRGGHGGSPGCCCSGRRGGVTGLTGEPADVFCRSVDHPIFGTRFRKDADPVPVLLAREGGAFCKDFLLVTPRAFEKVGSSILTTGVGWFGGRFGGYSCRMWCLGGRFGGWLLFGGRPGSYCGLRRCGF